MNSVDRTSSFFPNSKHNIHTQGTLNAKKSALKRNDPTRMTELNNITKHDAKVTIPKAVREFARIKKAVDDAPVIDNSKKIALIKDQIKNNQYKVDYEAIADKILQQEF